MNASPEKFQSKFLETVQRRGFIHQCTDAKALDALLAGGEHGGAPVVCYIGFDCTARSLHVGSLIQIMMLRHWQKAGHKPIVLMGGGTTKIGDPSGKDQSRQLLTDQQIAENMEGIKQVFARFLTFGDGPTDAVMVNNAEWLSDINYIDFLRDYGRLFSINNMLTMESVKQRLSRDSELTFLEFNYMILQAYDYVHLNRQYGCRLQVGGSDQWGNIVQGIAVSRSKKIIELNPDLRGSAAGWPQDEEDGKELQRKARQEFIEKQRDFTAEHGLFGLTTPLLTTASGVKMGKTASGAVWLNAELFSPFDYWQFWRNVEDADVGRFLRLFTELPLEEIERLEALTDQAINDAKKTLATEATALLHGRAAAEAAAETARQTFEQGMTAETLPEVAVEVAESIAAFQLFVASGLAASGGEARRLIQGGGARINDEKVDDATRSYSRAELEAMQLLKLSSGKKKHVRVTLA